MRRAVDLAFVVVAAITLCGCSLKTMAIKSVASTPPLPARRLLSLVDDLLPGEPSE